MSIVAAISVGEKLYAANIGEQQAVTIGIDRTSDLVIPDLGFRMNCRRNGLSFLIDILSGTGTRALEAPLDVPVAIDYDRRIAIMFSETDDKSVPIQLPQDCEIDIGKSDKPDLDGNRNTVVLDFPFVSRKHLRIVCAEGNVYVYDLQSTNGVFLNGVKINSAVLEEGDTLSIYTISITLSGHSLLIRNAGNKIKIYPIGQSGKIKAAELAPIRSADIPFSRSPRLVTGVESKTIAIEHPQRSSTEPHINWLTVLVTPLITIGVMVALILAMGMNPVMLIMTGVMSVFSAITAIVNYRKQKLQYREIDEKIQNKYRSYLKGVSDELHKAHQRQGQAIEEANPSPAECTVIAQTRSRRLWERLSSDQDFLDVRVGLGTIPASVMANFQQSQVSIEENKLEIEAKEIADNSKVIEEMPIICRLKTGKHIGMIGNKADEQQLLRNIIMELATAHAYDELKIVIVCPKSEISEWAWTRWLPHCADDQQSERYLLTSMEEGRDILDKLAEELGSRKNDDNYHSEETNACIPYYLFVIISSPWVLRHPIRKHILSDDELGCSALFADSRLNTLPKECRQIIEVGSGNGRLYDSSNAVDKVSFLLDTSSLADADFLARTIAPLHMTTGLSAASIPKSISFLEGYHVVRPEQLNIEERWNRAQTYKTLSVPIAATAGGGTFEFDIHEKRHGVNGIVAGMPGSGKTEMVQSWLLSLAINFSPEDLSFVLVDFKGTGMIAPFRDLPHLAGSISNLDKSVDRNLKAIQSEVHRREAIIDKYSSKSIKNINDLNRSYANGLVPEKLPILLIVIDEYAEFKKCFPDFGVEIDSLTSKGRALGIFVILMTQKPAGVVSAKSEDNIKFRWCLRVANYSASREMLGKPDAAKITIPGRAYIKIGEDDVYEEVQSFWSGAPYDATKKNRDEKPTPICRIELNGRRVPCETFAENRQADTQETEIDVIVRYIAAYCRGHRIKSADKIWTDRLPERFCLTDVQKEGFNGKNWEKTDKLSPIIGMIDDPANQRQFPMELDFARLGHTVVYGAPMSGKTTLLQTLAVSTAMSRKPDEVSVYIMDFGGWNMSVLRDFPHVGGIANDNEPERLKKLILMLTDILQERKAKFAKQGVGNIAAYRDACGDAIPDILLVVDNFGAMIKMYPDFDSFFVTLTSTGANYGVYLVATATANNGVPIKISQNIKNALALQMIDKSDYTFTVGKVSGELPQILGRGYAKGKPPLEFQTALPAPGSDDKKVSDNIRRLAKLMQTVWQGDLPDQIPELPEMIAYGSIRTSCIALGLSTDKVQPVVYDYTKQHYLLISGTDQSGKSNMLQVVARQLNEKLSGKLYVFNIKGSGLKELRSEADAWLTTAGEIDAFVEGLRPELQRRHAEKQNDPKAHFEAIVLAVDDYTAFFKAVSNDTIARLLAVVKIGKGYDLYFVTAGGAYELSSFFNKGEALTLALGKAKQAVMLGGCMNDHGAIQTKASFSEKKIPVREHEGIFISDNSNTVFKAMEIQGEVS